MRGSDWRFHLLDVLVQEDLLCIPSGGPRIIRSWQLTLRSGIFKGRGHYPCVSKQCPADGAWRSWQGSVSRHGLLDTVYPLREHLNSVHLMVSGECCGGALPDTICWTRLRNTWINPGERHSRDAQDDGAVTLCTLRAATVLSRGCRADSGRPLAKKVMSDSRDGCHGTIADKHCTFHRGVESPPSVTTPEKAPDKNLLQPKRLLFALKIHLTCCQNNHPTEVRG